MVNRRKPIPLYLQLKEEILEKIKKEKWTIDSQIPTEKELMESYNVGRATVREAVSILVNEGYIYKKKGIGTFVARKNPTYGFEPLISLTYSLKARGIRAYNKVVEKDKIHIDQLLLDKLKWTSTKECYYLKRLRYVENTPIAIEHSYFDETFKKIDKEYDLTTSLAKIIIEDLNVNIDRVEQVIVPRKPKDMEKLELNLEDDKLILDLERWIYINNNPEPFYYLKFVIPSDIYNYPF
ncbi:GntR family transcriptional regulator [Dethiothermospora halolimnae]|uniref:GntR family transcriptional regulator n=1 Tax=Dethiothermospora halolimnae TaxID=3114390 RepID=UPI003CCBE0AF